MNIYEYKGKQYRIFAESKMKIDGEWIDCIIYQTLYFNEDGWIWVRSRDEFFSLFKLKNDLKKPLPPPSQFIREGQEPKQINR